MTKDPLVSVDWLIEHIKAPDIRIVDATWIAPWTIDPDNATTAQSIYAAEHIPGAVHFDIESIADPNSDLPHMMPSPEMFSSRVRKMGLGDGNRIVVYDRGSFMASARVWAMFRIMGHEDVVVLDGGLNAWLAAGQETSDLPPIPSERHFTVRVQNHLLKSFEQVEAAVRSKDTPILDARPKGRFDGTAPEPREGLRSGHIPGSMNIPASGLMDENGLMKSVSDLQDLFGNIVGAKPVIATCGSGVSAAVILLALARLGRDEAALYDGSWSEWAGRGTIETTA